MRSQIMVYEEMSLLSSRMVEAARGGDWDNLIELERDVACLREALNSTPEDHDAPAPDVALKRRLIQCILENDAEVRRHTEPWMEHLRQYLGDGGRRREAHGAGGEAATGSPEG